MENFSIVKFLQSMLTPPSVNAEETQEKMETSTTSPETETPPVDESFDHNQQAVLRFIEEHERRAKKHRDK